MVDTLTWITGGSSGIGRALVETLPFADAHVVDVSRSGGAPRTEHLRADLADPASWAAVEAHLVSRLSAFDGRRAVFVHSAGTLSPIGFAGEVDSAAYRANVLLNAAAPQVLGHAFLRALDGFDGRADLVMLSSGAARTAYEGWSAYCAGKAALDQWVRAAGAEQARRGGRCRVLAVAPGVVATPMQAAIRRQRPEDFPRVERFQQLHASGELAEPHDVARRMWALLDRELDNGAVVDLREL